MLILLPPSETKTDRTRGRSWQPESLAMPSLGPARAEVVEALSEVSRRSDAAKVLGVSPNLTAEIARNTRLDSAPALPASALYTGVLYDALGLAGLDPMARRRAHRRVVVISALFGAVRLSDRIPPYRLSMGVNLPGVGPLVAHWRTPLAAVLPGLVGRGLVVDCRSSTYAAAWAPQDDLTQRWVAVRVPGATHMAKHTRGLLARALCESPADPRTPHALAESLKPRFGVTLQEPSSPRAPWVLEATA
ncbi:MAG: YaaA family protein [Ornithinimicrobium sp.]|uniref:YaaA family protein n=1 Tax=Ornithinimicrobium sp. TaxID=1977084 RepID=UPI003D9B59A7